jgi:hypothetical protein
MSSSGSIAVWTIAVFAIGCAASEPIDLKVIADGSASATGGNRSTSQGSGGAAGGSGGNGSGGTNGVAGGGANGSGGIGGTAGNLERGASGGASGRGGGGGHGGIAGTSGGGAGTSGGGAGTSGGGGRKGGAGGASTAPTFTEVYKSILIVYCGGSRCHDPGSQAGLGFSTQSGAYQSLANFAVIPGDSQGSSLYTLVATGVMPPAKPMLSSDFIDEIGAWIDAGALNN